MNLKPGYIEFKSQQDINRSRREKTNNEFKLLREQVQEILLENHKIINKKMTRAN